MADMTFVTAENQTVSRNLLILYLNTGSKDAPEWSPIGKRVEDSSMELDWQRETKKDILNNTYSSMKDPIITQSFDPWELANGDKAQLSIWNKAIRDHDAAALANMDMLVVHLYAGAQDAVFAERYESSAVETTGLGGAGGGSIGMPITVTFGGTRTVGTAKVAEGVVTFTPAVA